MSWTAGSFPPEGATLISVVHRHGLGSDAPRTGFLTGWGRWRGGFGTTVSHDSHNLTLFGATPEDLALAARALIDCGGGMVACATERCGRCCRCPWPALSLICPWTQLRTRFMRSKARWTRSSLGATLPCVQGARGGDAGLQCRPASDGYGDRRSYDRETARNAGPGSGGVISGLQSASGHPDPERRAGAERAVVEIIGWTVMRRPARHAVSKPDIGAGHGIGKEGKVITGRRGREARIDTRRDIPRCGKRHGGCVRARSPPGGCAG